MSDLAKKNELAIYELDSYLRDSSSVVQEAVQSAIAKIRDKLAEYFASHSAINQQWADEICAARKVYFDAHAAHSAQVMNIAINGEANDEDRLLQEHYLEKFGIAKNAEALLREDCRAMIDTLNVQLTGALAANDALIKEEARDRAAKFVEHNLLLNNFYAIPVTP